MTHDQIHREPDPRIDAVLQALGHASPDDAMQDRLLTTLRHAENAADRDSVPTRWPVWRWQRQPVALWLAAATVLLVAAGTLLHRSGMGRVQHHYVVSLRASTQQRGNSASLVNPLPMLSTPSPSRGLSMVGAPRNAPLTHTSAMQNESFPPPPLPMTEQERLLLRLARHDSPELLAQLTGPARDAEFQRQKAAVAEFFASDATSTEEQNEAPAITQASSSAAAASQQTPTLETP